MLLATERDTIYSGVELRIGCMLLATERDTIHPILNSTPLYSVSLSRQ